MVTARAAGERVEVTGERTETSTTWANPDGTTTLEGHTGVVRFKDAAGGWRDVDLTLERRSDGTVAPKGHVLGLRLAGRATKAQAAEAISVTEKGGRTVTVGWPGALPEPVLDGTRATYPGVTPGVDMVVETLRSGFEQFMVLRDRPVGAVSWELPVKTKGLTAQAEEEGSISFVDGKGTVVSRIPAAEAWDARIDERTGDPVNRASVALTVTQKSPGQAVLTVTPDAAWLADPDTVFPVTVDPTYASATRNVFFDTFVQEGYTTDQSGATELKLGNNGSGQVARSFLEFQLGSLDDKKIITADLKLRATHSWSCTAREWGAYHVTPDVNTGTRWTTAQPTWGARHGVSTVTKGYSSSCPNGDVSIRITSLVQDWADDSDGTNRVGLRASNEGDAYGWKKFASAEAANPPSLEVTYNRVPGTASAPTVAPVTPYAGASYTSDTTPALTSKATDADGNTVKLTFEVHNSTAGTASSLKASCTTGYVAAGTNATCSPATAVADNATYYVRAKANDSFKDGAWSGWTTVRMAAATPAVPVITCPGYVDGSWQPTPPAQNVTCTITAAGTGTNAPGYIRYSIDGAAVVEKVITPSSNPAIAKVDVTVSAAVGGHAIQAWAKTPSQKISAEKKYAFGYGTLGVQAPSGHPMLVTTSAVDIAASGPPNSGGTLPAATLKWRVAASGEGEQTGWNTAKTLAVAADSGTGGLKITGRWDSMTATRDAAANGGAGLDLDARVPVLLELQVCVAYTAGEQCTWFNDARTILRVPHAFGEGFPVAAAGPGQVALWTGEFNTQTTDVTVPGYTGDLSVSRSHSTYAGAPTAASGVFGPGWSAQLDGPDAGAAGFEVIDNTRTDGTIIMLSAEGVPMIFAPQTGWARRTGTDLVAGAWRPVDDETGHLGVSVQVAGTGTSTRFTFTDPDGVVTTFKATTAPTATAAAVFAPESVVEPGVAGQVSYSHDAQGRVTRILAPLPTGMTAADCPATGALAPGCRALDLTYATTTTATAATPGDVAGQVTQISLRIYNPAKAGGAGMDQIVVATYKYDGTSKRLVEVTDSRTGLATGYGYDSQSRLTTITPPGLTPYQLEYAGDPGKLAKVKRDRPASAGGGTATLATVLYGVPTSGNGLPDMTADAVMAGWEQEKAPVYAAAVFGPDQPIGSLDPAQVAPGDWASASLFYTDDRGYTLNTASHGAGEWLPTHTVYDDHGHPVKQYDAGDIAAIKAGETTAGQAGTVTVYNTAGNGPAATPSGAVVTDSYGPTRWVTLADGTPVQARPHTHTGYDEGSPNSGINPTTNAGWRLPTTTTIQAVHPTTLAPIDAQAPISVTKTGYGTGPADVNGWKLGLPTSSTQVMGGSTPDIVRVTDYDAEGRVVATRQPESDGTDAGTRKSVYYTVAANATHPACGGKPEWAGLECKTFFAGQAAGGQDLVTTTTAGYSYLLTPTDVVETGNGATRTTTTVYDAAGRVTTTWTDATGLPGSVDAPGAQYGYDPATGLATERWATDATGTPVGDPITTSYDPWGRTISYTPTPGETTTTVYDAAGRVASVADPTGTKTFGYDGSDAAGNQEHRGLATKVTISNPGGTDLVFTGAYNPDGTLTTQKLPGGVTQRVQVDAAGEPVGLTYSGQVTTVTDDGAGGTTSTVEPDENWFGWSVENDLLGRVAREWTPSAAGYTGGLETGAGAGYDRGYSYDRAGRLVTVADKTVPAGAAGYDETTGDLTGTVCQTRAYGFDPNGNRTSLTRTAANPDGTCGTPGGAGDTTRSWSYDTADRLTGGYGYDPFGRVTTLPAVDTPAAAAGGGGAGDLTLGYYDTDAIASITQDGTTTAFTLDAAGRRAVETTGPDGLPATATITRHYTDAEDNPAWVQVEDATGTSHTRYATGLGGDLAATITTPDTGGTPNVTLPVTDLHGDVLTTIRQSPETVET